MKKEKKKLTIEDINVDDILKKHSEKNITFFLPIQGYKTHSIGKVKLINMIRKHKSFEKLEMEIEKLVEKHGVNAVLPMSDKLFINDKEENSVEYNMDNLKKLLDL